MTTGPDPRMTTDAGRGRPGAAGRARFPPDSNPGAARLATSTDGEAATLEVCRIRLADGPSGPGSVTAVHLSAPPLLGDGGEDVGRAGPLTRDPSRGSVSRRGPRDDLVAEADAEERPTVDDRRPSEADEALESRRVAGSRRQDEPVDVVGERLLGAGRVGEDAHARAAATKRADDVLLEAEIEDGDERATLGRIADLAHGSRRHEPDEVLLRPARCRRGGRG